MYEENVGRPEPSNYRCSLLLAAFAIITAALLQPSARFSSPWYEWRLLEDAIVWRVEQKKGKKMRTNQPSIFLSAVPPFTLSCSPSLSLPPCLLSISVGLPHSLLYPIFSQGRTCVMALLSPPDHYKPSVNPPLITPLSRYHLQEASRHCVSSVLFSLYLWNVSKRLN